MKNDWADLPPPGGLGLRGAPNFRDFGGYRTRDGRQVRRKLLFRSGHLGNLTVEDRETLAMIGLRTVCDLRGRWEREQTAPAALAGVRHHACEIEPAILTKLRSLQASDTDAGADAAAQVMVEVYQDYVRSWTRAFRSLFAVLLDGEAPLVFHCAAGKDRTGIAAALVLSALGVPRPTVLHDYLLSRLFWREAPHDHPQFSEAVVRVAGSVEAHYLDAAFKVIDREHNGLQPYLRESLGLGPRERRRLAELYLEPLGAHP